MWGQGKNSDEILTLAPGIIIKYAHDRSCRTGNPRLPGRLCCQRRDRVPGPGARRPEGAGLRQPRRKQRTAPVRQDRRPPDPVRGCFERPGSGAVVTLSPGAGCIHRRGRPGCFQRAPLPAVFRFSRRQGGSDDWSACCSGSTGCRVRLSLSPGCWWRCCAGIPPWRLSYPPCQRPCTAG